MAIRANRICPFLWLASALAGGGACLDSARDVGEGRQRPPGVGEKRLTGMAAPSGPTVSTDMADYVPGETALISGTGWGRGETVDIAIACTCGCNGALSAVADDAGAFAGVPYVILDEHIGTTCTVTATGGSSGLVATTAFTDLPLVGSVTVGLQAPRPVVGGGIATYTVTVNRASGTTTQFTADLSVTSLPSGVSGSFEPASLTFQPTDASLSSTLTLSLSTSVPTQITTFLVDAVRSDNSGDNAEGTGQLLIAGFCAVNAPTAVCRPATGPCDVDDVCGSSKDACPADLKVPTGTVCLPAAGPCDVAESCDGVSNDCPADALLPPTTVCRPAAGVCDVAETCTGTSAACPPDTFQSATTVCRPAAGVCDLAESCTGTSAACPAEAKSTAVCRPAAGPCDVAESCDGVSNDCPADVLQAAGVECRPSAGICDVAETCTGASAACPADAKSTAVCRPAHYEYDANGNRIVGPGLNAV